MSHSEVRPAAELDYRISPRLELLDIVGAAEIEGAPAVAFVEMAWPPDYLEANREAARSTGAVVDTISSQTLASSL